MASRSHEFQIGGEAHRVFKRGDQVFVDHVEKDGGKYDVMNLTKLAGAKSVKDGVKAVRDYHSGRRK